MLTWSSLGSFWSLISNEPLKWIQGSLCQPGTVRVDLPPFLGVSTRWELKCNLFYFEKWIKAFSVWNSKCSKCAETLSLSEACTRVSFTFFWDLFVFTADLAYRFPDHLLSCNNVLVIKTAFPVTEEAAVLILRVTSILYRSESKENGGF